MPKINVTILESGQQVRVGRLGLKTVGSFVNTINNITQIDPTDLLDNVLFEIRNNIIIDTLNNDGSNIDEIVHILTGNLFDSIDAKVVERFHDSLVRGTAIDFGYFIPYGANLEEGVDGHSKAYPIIRPIWDRSKNQFKEDLYEEVKTVFRQNFGVR